MRRFNFSSAVGAGFIATVVMTIFMAFFDMNIMKMLGMTMGKTGAMAYIFGGLVHLAIGLIYGCIYALIIQPIFSSLPGFLSGTIFGVIIFVIALIFTPMFMKTLHRWGSGKSTVKLSAAPQHTSYHSNPCQMQPRGQPDQYSQNQMDSSQAGQQYDQYGRPVQPNQNDQYGRPVQPNQNDQYGRPVPQPNSKGSPASHPCMAHPCAHKKDGLPAWLWVLINHVVYGFVLGIFYRPRKINESGQGDQ